MFASLAPLAMAAQVPLIVIPLQKAPPRVEQAIAPIETAGPAFDAACAGSDDWEKPAPPVRVFGNTYFVGTCGISSILVTDPQGDILIDGGTEADAELIADNIRRLGFRLTDVKYLLNSHEHFDHVGGIARLQQLTGAQLLASPAAAAVLRTGVPGSDDPQAGSLKTFPAAHVDRVIRDGEMIRLGNTVLTAVATPGHTPGALTWHWGSCNGGVCRQIVYADSLTAVSNDKYRFTDHPAYVQAFRASIAKVAALDCDILLTPHLSASKMPERFALRAPLEDRDACRDYAADRTKQLDDRLAKEAATH
jgi:metallo-beta-lactamase class B